MTVLDMFTDENVDLPDDRTPPVDHGAEYPCQICGVEAGPYGGRGPKPKYCAAHKKGGARKTGASAPRNGNATMAANAADALNQFNSVGAVIAMLFGMPMTGSAIAARQDEFREQAYAALLTDPQLCSSILKGGTNSSKVALIIAYAMLGAGVAPYAINEYKEKKEARNDEAGSENN